MVIAAGSIVLAILGLVWVDHWWGRLLTYAAVAGCLTQVAAAFWPSRERKH